MFEAFETRTVAGAGAEIFCRIGGSGTPLLLLHGYPQTGAMWAPIAERLAERFTLVIPDLRGYGRSSHPDSEGGANYSKRAMASDFVAVMAALGHERFAVAGHDRGARVAYRMALDHPDAITRLAVLDIVPTVEMWDRMDWQAAIGTYHWQFLAQPNPMPERLIGADPVYYLDHTLASWTKNKSLAPFGSEALVEYRRAFSQSDMIHAVCEDYRAGATIDREADLADREAGRRIEAPMLALWGSDGTPAAGGSVLETWERWCTEISGRPIDAGHFLVEEAPDDTAAALLEFFGS